MAIAVSDLRTRIVRRLDLYCLVLVVGYGLCRSLNNLTYPIAVASIVGVFPLTGDDLHFSIIASSAIMLGAAACAFFGWGRPRSTLARSGLAALLLLGAVNLCSGLGLLDSMPQDIVNVALPMLYGLASVVSNVAWLVPFVNLGPRRCLVTLTTSVLLSATFCLLLGRLPLVIQCISLAVTGAVCALLFVRITTMDPGDDLMSTDPTTSDTKKTMAPAIPAAVRATGVDDASPVSSAAGTHAPTAPDRATRPAEAGRSAFTRTIRVLLELWSPLIIYTMSTCLVGFVSAFLAFNPLDEGSLPKTLAVLVGALCISLLAIFTNRVIDLRRSFQFAFPAMAVALGVIPFLGPSYGIVFNTLLNFLYTIASISALFLFIETIRVRKAPAVAVFASMMFVVRVSLVVSLLIGVALGTRDSQDELMHGLMLALVISYILVFTLIMLLRAKPSAIHEVSVPVSSDAITYNQATPVLDDDQLEAAPDQVPGLDARPTPAGKDTAQPEASTRTTTYPVIDPTIQNPADEPGSLAHIEKRSHELAAAARLTPREREIIVLLARGRTTPHIATELGLSANTVRSYVQSTYSKLNVHSKQELIDLLEE